MICENALLSLFPVYHKHNAAHRMHPFSIYVYIAISNSEFCLLNACFNGIIEERIHFNIILLNQRRRLLNEQTALKNPYWDMKQIPLQANWLFLHQYPFQTSAFRHIC